MPDSESLQIRRYLLNRRAASPTSLAEQRISYELLVDNYLGHPVPLPKGTNIETVDVQGIPAVWINPPDADAERVLLYLHGGGYILGSRKSHSDLVARMATAAGIRSLLIEYRLAPEHVFPAAIDDALAAYRWLLANGTKPEHLLLAGDSAGGGLTLALLQVLRDKHISMPAGAVLLSPWTDLVGTVESRTARESSDPIFTAQEINSLARFYVSNADRRNPLISPINADLHGFPPLRIDVGTDEVLLDDSLLIAQHAKAANIPVELAVWDGMWHVFQQFAYVLPEGQQSLEQMGRFMRQHTKLSQ